VVELDAADLATIGEAIRALGAGLLTGDPQITGALVNFADAAPPAAAAGTTPADITPADIIASFAGCTVCSISPGPTTPNASTSSSTRPSPPTNSSWIPLPRPHT
jgi:hypothetical protein